MTDAGFTPSHGRVLLQLFFISAMLSRRSYGEMPATKEIMTGGYEIVARRSPPVAHPRIDFRDGGPDSQTPVPQGRLSLAQICFSVGQFGEHGKHSLAL